MRLNGVHNGFALFILAGKFHAQGNMAAFHLVVQSLADVVQQTCAAGQSLISTQFRGHQPGNITHFQAVLEHALAVGSTVFQFTKQAHQLRVNGTAVGFQYSLLALLLNGGVHLALGLFVQLLNAGGMNAAVLDQSLQGQAGNLSAHRVKGADGDGFRRVVNDQFNAGNGFNGADVAPLTADDAAFHLVIGQCHNGDGGLCRVIGGAALNGSADDLPRQHFALVPGHLLVFEDFFALFRVQFFFQRGQQLIFCFLLGQT